MDLSLECQIKFLLWKRKKGNMEFGGRGGHPSILFLNEHTDSCFAPQALVSIPFSVISMCSVRYLFWFLAEGPGNAEIGLGFPCIMFP